MSEINYNIDIPYKKYTVSILNKNVDKYIRKDCNKSDRDVKFFIITKNIKIKPAPFLRSRLTVYVLYFSRRIIIGLYLQVYALVMLLFQIS